MYALKPFIFILLLCGGFNVLSEDKPCKDESGNDIENSTTTTREGQNNCECNSGYTQSGSDNWSNKGSNKFSGACILSKNDWLTPFAIGGGIVASGVGVGAGVVGYKFFKTNSTDSLEHDWLSSTKSADSGTSIEWSGENYDYAKSVFGRRLAGGKTMIGLTDDIKSVDLETQIQKAVMRNYSPRNPFTNPNVQEARSGVLKFDPVSGENVVVDKEHRLLGEWNKSTREWESADGAERWRYSSVRRYKVISTSDSNYLNPNTNNFEEDILHPRWKGNNANYLDSFKENLPELSGNGVPVENVSSKLEDLKIDKDFEQQTARINKMKPIRVNNSDVSMVRDTGEGENILIDKNGFKFSEWNRIGKTWNPVKGAKFWRYSDTYEGSVYADSKTSMFNPETERFEKVPTDDAWSGPDMGEPYLRTIREGKLVLKGYGESIDELTDPNLNDPDIRFQLNKRNTYVPELVRSYNDIKIKFDPVSNENILVDQNDRLLARWNAVNKEWDPVKGASRWRFSKTFKYRVISENNNNFYDPTTNRFELISDDSAEWTGTNTEYKTHANIFERPLKGTGEPLEGLEDAKDNVDIVQQRSSSDEYNFIRNKNIRIKHDPATNENMVVDNQNRLLAKWDSSAREWVPADGAERWTWNKKLGYNVIAKDENGNNFLNPHTEEFEENGTENTADWQMDHEAESSVKNTKALDGSANEVIRVKADVHRAAEYEIVDSEPKDAISLESGDYQIPFDSIREGEPGYNMRASLERVADENESEEIEMRELGPDRFGGAGCGYYQ